MAMLIAVTIEPGEVLPEVLPPWTVFSRLAGVMTQMGMKHFRPMTSRPALLHLIALLPAAFCSATIRPPRMTSGHRLGQNRHYSSHTGTNTDTTSRNTDTAGHDTDTAGGHGYCR